MRERYFDRLRWVEMFFAALAAFLGAVQWQMQQGKTFREGAMAGSVAAAVAVGLYFREPKEPAVAPALSRLEAALQRAAAPVDISSGSDLAMGAIGDPPGEAAPVSGKPPRGFATLEDIPLRGFPGVSSHEERVGDRTVHVMESPRRAATPEGPIDGAPPMHD